jgi:hypothetical protein
MASFFRILENSGMGSFGYLVENMSTSQAAQVFAFHGVGAADTMTPEALVS